MEIIYPLTVADISYFHFHLKAAVKPLLPLSMVRRMVRKMFHGGAPVTPVVSIVAAIGIRISGSQVLTICVRVELRAVAGVFDNCLRQRGSRGSCCDNGSGADQCEFHLVILE